MSERDDALRQLVEEMAEMSDRLAADAQTALAQRILRWAHRISALLDAQAAPAVQTCECGRTFSTRGRRCATPC
jgi:hypothetical protein